MADVDFDTMKSLFDKAGGHEVRPDALIRAIIDVYRITFEAARDVIYRWIDSGRAVLTAEWRVRITE